MAEKDPSQNIISEKEPEGGTDEWQDMWKEREAEARELLYGKKIGDRAVLKRSEGGRYKGEIQTDWRIAGYVERDNGNTKVVISREADKMTEIKYINEDEFFTTNFEGSEEIVDTLKRNLDHVRQLTITPSNISHANEKQAKAEGMLKDFMNGDMESTLKYYQQLLANKKAEEKAQISSFNKAAERMHAAQERAKEASIGDDLQGLELDVTLSVNNFRETRDRVNKTIEEAKKLEKTINSIEDRMKSNK